MTLSLSTPELLAVASGESIVAFVPRGTVSEGDEVDLVSDPGRRPAVKPAYRRWLDAPAPAPRRAVVVAVDPAQLLDPAAGSARHVLAASPAAGDLVLLRVEHDDGPVLSDEAFAARRRSVEGAMR